MNITRESHHIHINAKEKTNEITRQENTRNTKEKTTKTQMDVIMNVVASHTGTSAEAVSTTLHTRPTP
jgi:hypothetical protein